MARPIDKMKDRWVLIKWHRGRVFYYRGAKHYPTDKFELAYTYPSGERAAKQTRFMYSGARYKPVPTSEKLIFKAKLQGVK